jgi:two-component system, cell cycle response regulator
MTNPEPSYQVLVVDDSPVYRKLVEHALEPECYTLQFAKSGKEAMELFAKHAPSFVITDWMMPDICGLELCQYIRADLNHPYTYVILLTSIAEKDSVVKGLAAGADDYLTKPFDPGELLARIGVGRRIIDLNREVAAKTQLLEAVARTDSLTGLPNRRAIEEWADRQIRGAARHAFPVWVVLGDIDTFKSVNDNFGHDAGDAVLQAFADVLRDNTRASDICGRLGGDEFVLVITHADREKIGRTVDRFREQFANLIFSFAGKSVNTTASFGVAGFLGTEAPEFGLLLRQADRALYAAKRGGRNQIQVEMLYDHVPAAKVKP